jgi:hypothetical protein
MTTLDGAEKLLAILSLCSSGDSSPRPVAAFPERPDLADDNGSGDVLVSDYTRKPDKNFDVELPWVSEGYLKTLGIPLAAGRYFAASDTEIVKQVPVSISIPSPDIECRINGIGYSIDITIHVESNQPNMIET